MSSYLLRPVTYGLALIMPFLSGCTDSKKDIEKPLITHNQNSNLSESERAKLLVRDVSANLENLSPGASVHVKRWVSDLKKSEDVFKLPLIEKYIERLAIHGETDLDDALYSFTSTQVVPTESLIENLLKLHSYSGIIRVDRFVDSRKSLEERQKTLEDTISEFVKNFEDKNYKKDNKIIVVYLTGVIQDGEENGKDMFAVGGDLLIQDLQKNRYKILPFEIDKDEQIIDGAQRVCEATGKTIDLVLFCGHGTSQSTNFGFTERLITRRNPNQNYIRQIREKHSDYVKEVETKKIWGIKNLANSNLTEGGAHLDVGDIGIMKSLQQYLSSNARAIFASCSVADDKEGHSLAKTFAQNTKMTVIGPTVSIGGLIPQYNEKGDVIGIVYLDQLFKPLGPEYSKVYSPR